MPSTGEVNPVFSAYRCVQCQFIMAFPKGQFLPPCPSCGKDTEWVIVRAQVPAKEPAKK